MEATMNRPVESLIGGRNPHLQCIEICAKCTQICQECLNLCLKERDANDRMNCIKTLQDCAEICSTAACFMSRQSSSVKEICNVCAVVCEKCATECGMFKDQHCQSCADTCRQCASECRNMTNM